MGRCEIIEKWKVSLLRVIIFLSQHLLCIILPGFFPSLEKRTIYTNGNFRKIQGNTIPSLISIIVLEVSHIFGLVRYSTHFLEPRIFLFCWYSNSYNSAETNEMEVSNGFYQKI